MTQTNDWLMQEEAPETETKTDKTEGDKTTSTKTKKTTKEKEDKDEYVAVVFDPRLDGADNLGQDPNFPPLRRLVLAPIVGRDTRNRPIRKELVLPPGVTLGVDKNIWDKALEGNRYLRTRVGRSIQVFTPSNKKYKKELDLRPFNEDDAITLIEYCDETEKLELWQRVENRQSVVEKISQRLTYLQT